MRLWNVAGALVSPNAIKLKVAVMSEERRLLNVIHMHVDLMIAGVEVKLGENRVSWGSSRSSSTIGMGKLSFGVASLRARFSMQKHHDESCFTNLIGEFKLPTFINSV